MDNDKFVDTLIKHSPRLERLFEITIKQSDTKGFFTHLNNYVELISEDDVLNAFAWSLSTTAYNVDHPKNAHRLSEVRGKLEETLPQFSRLIDDIDEDHKGSSRLYYCWVKLSGFYQVYKLSPAQRAEIDKLAKVESRHEQISKEFDNIFQKNDDSQNTLFTRKDFQLYLEVFQSQLENWVSMLPTESPQLEPKPSKPMLPPLVADIGGGFAIHEGNIIVFEGKEIELEKRLRNVATEIMKRTQKGQYTSKEYVADNLLDDNHDYDLPYDYAVKLVSATRKAFRNQLNSKHDYFPVKSGIGYKFQP